MKYCDACKEKNLVNYNKHFDEVINESVGEIVIIDEIFKPADILKQMKPETYNKLLGEFIQQERS